MPCLLIVVSLLSLALGSESAAADPGISASFTNQSTHSPNVALNVSGVFRGRWQTALGSRVGGPLVWRFDVFNCGNPLIQLLEGEILLRNTPSGASDLGASRYIVTGVHFPRMARSFCFSNALPSHLAHSVDTAPPDSGDADIVAFLKAVAAANVGNNMTRASGALTISGRANPFCAGQSAAQWIRNLLISTFKASDFHGPEL